MPTAITPKPTFDPAVAASNLPPSLQWLGGALGSVASDITGAGDPNQSIMGVGNPMMAADTELSPLAKALYSRVDKIAGALPEWLHPAKALSIFKNNTAKEELEHRGLAQLLTERQGPDKISKAEILSHLEANPPPQVGVKTLRNSGVGAELRVQHPDWPEWEITQELAKSPTTQYSRPDLNVPGGKNYTESLFKLDQKRPPLDEANFKSWMSKKYGVNDVSPIAKQEYLNSYYQDRGAPEYQSSHWNNEPNVLAHTREDIRPDSSGVPGKFLQEVQSDWHQAGKEHGYGKPTGFQSVDDPTPPFEGVPDAPFKDTWPDLTLKKHVLDVANSPDQNWLGFTKGSTQADRYNLAKHVDTLAYDTYNNRLFGIDKHGNHAFEHFIKPEEVSDYIGQDLSDRLFNSPNQNALHYLSGADLQVGGEGMKHFYDQVLPSRLNKILKPFGGSVEEGAITTGPKAIQGNRWGGVIEYPTSSNEGVASVWPKPEDAPSDAAGDAAIRLARSMREQPAWQKTAPAWLARLTPEMKDAIKKAGLPLMTLLLSRQLDKQNALINPSGQGQ